MSESSHIYLFFFFNDTATTEIYTLSLHDALPICTRLQRRRFTRGESWKLRSASAIPSRFWRSEEHTSELQSQSNLVCRLLLEKKKKSTNNDTHANFYILHPSAFTSSTSPSSHAHC